MPKFKGASLSLEFECVDIKFSTSSKATVGCSRRRPVFVLSLLFHLYLTLDRSPLENIPLQRGPEIEATTCKFQERIRGKGGKAEGNQEGEPWGEVCGLDADHGRLSCQLSLSLTDILLLANVFDRETCRHFGGWIRYWIFQLEINQKLRGDVCLVFQLRGEWIDIVLKDI